MPTVDTILKLFSERGDSEYGGEAVTQREHALQCAMLAEEDGATADLISAALLHDIGHLVHALPEDAPDHGVDDEHEELGYRFLTSMFGDEVAEPVRLHVPAKRYLCATHAKYMATLSDPSITSLNLQGGPMSAEEVAEFAAGAFAEDAVRLRRWDDKAKVRDLPTPSLEHFVPYLRTVLRA